MSFDTFSSFLDVLLGMLFDTSFDMPYNMLFFLKCSFYLPTFPVVFFSFWAMVGGIGGRCGPGSNSPESFKWVKAS